ncbi:hypothetical protein FJ949_29560 [Mesorhizobium sp. B2-4-1]|nr:hypothetical protein FJ947_30460 [Mesorhizobium sp. B2-4-8]TPL58048.1 hypothetical protein FJ949_29560 [Mesorhizobium sp. B2-4-1]TPM88438.1 hypothetical protein FJ966_30720 [Mesorhizobium sp. B2-1-5]
MQNGRKAAMISHSALLSTPKPWAGECAFLSSRPDRRIANAKPTGAATGTQPHLIVLTDIEKDFRTLAVRYQNPFIMLVPQCIYATLSYCRKIEMS